MEFDVKVFRRLALCARQERYEGLEDMEDEYAEMNFVYCGEDEGLTWNSDVCDLYHDLRNDFGLKELCRDEVQGKIDEVVNNYAELAFYYGREVEKDKEVLLSQTGTTVVAGLKDVEVLHIPDGVNSIGSRAFADCKSLKVVHIPQGVTTIGKQAFENCINLEEVYLPEGLEEIEGVAFQYCANLKKINLPDGLDRIMLSAFRGCKKLVIPELPKGLRWIEGYAFEGCTIENCCLDEAIEYIQEGVFHGCNLPNGLRIENKNLEIGHFADYCDAITAETYLFGWKKGGKKNNVRL